MRQSLEVRLSSGGPQAFWLDKQKGGLAATTGGAVELRAGHQVGEARPEGAARVRSRWLA